MSMYIHSATVSAGKVDKRNDIGISIPRLESEDTTAVAAEEYSVALPQFVEVLFTISIIFSFTLMPFAMAGVLAPLFLEQLTIGPGAWLLAPYVLGMTVLGIKVSSLFGCSLWSKLTREEKEYQCD